MINKTYSGIGSRSVPKEIYDEFYEIAIKLSNKGYTLFSGGAEGCDSAFELGCNNVNGNKLIYLPWKKFNNNTSQLYSVSKEALELASKIHPEWDKCSRASRLLHGRNCYQVLSETLNDPVKFVICWTEGGVVKGGTATAIKLAVLNNIPVYNFGSEKQRKEFLSDEIWGKL